MNKNIIPVCTILVDSDFFSICGLSRAGDRGDYLQK
jgi:hypothetical protein